MKSKNHVGYEEITIRKEEIRITRKSEEGFPKQMEATIFLEDGKFLQCTYTQGMSHFSTPYNATQWEFLGYLANRIKSLPK